MTIAIYSILNSDSESLCSAEGREMRIYQIYNCIFMCFVVSSLSFNFGGQMSENELKLSICLTQAGISIF